MTIHVDEGNCLPFEQPLLYVIAVTGATITSIILLLLMKTRGEKRGKELKEIGSPKILEPTALEIVRSVTAKQAKQAQEELRMLELEREILSDAIRRLYEAHAEGKITKREREMLARRYKSRMTKVRDAISKKESVAALHELESMQQDLIKLFDERFDELNRKIEQLRSRVEITPKKKLVAPKPVQAFKRVKKREKQKELKKPPKPSPPAKTEAEKRIEKIRLEVEKVLQRLEQIETEA
ncbi:MAG: hypothetical protein U9O89_07570 [Thermoproteota archaeon]|nr:hypothetical protein [Thermoproteota archaeon]